MSKQHLDSSKKPAKRKETQGAGPDYAPPVPWSAHEFLQLQQTFGNRAVGSYLQSALPPTPAAAAEPAAADVGEELAEEIVVTAPREAVVGGAENSEAAGGEKSPATAAAGGGRMTSDLGIPPERLPEVVADISSFLRAAEGEREGRDETLVEEPAADGKVATVTLDVPIDESLLASEDINYDLAVRAFRTLFRQYGIPLDIRLAGELYRRSDWTPLMGDAGVRAAVNEALAKEADTIRYVGQGMPSLVPLYKQIRAEEKARYRKLVEDLNKIHYAEDAIKSFYIAHWNGLIGVIGGMADLIPSPVNLVRSALGMQGVKLDFGLVEKLTMKYPGEYGNKYGGTMESGVVVGLMLVPGGALSEGLAAGTSWLGRLVSAVRPGGVPLGQTLVKFLRVWFTTGGVIESARGFGDLYKTARQLISGQKELEDGTVQPLTGEDAGKLLETLVVQAIGAYGDAKPLLHMGPRPTPETPRAPGEAAPESRPTAEPELRPTVESESRPAVETPAGIRPPEPAPRESDAQPPETKAAPPPEAAHAPPPAGRAPVAPPPEPKTAPPEPEAKPAAETPAPEPAPETPAPEPSPRPSEEVKPQPPRPEPKAAEPPAAPPREVAPEQPARPPESARPPETAPLADAPKAEAATPEVKPEAPAGAPEPKPARKKGGGKKKPAKEPEPAAAPEPAGPTPRQRMDSLQQEKARLQKEQQRNVAAEDALKARAERLKNLKDVADENLEDLRARGKASPEALERAGKEAEAANDRWEEIEQQLEEAREKIARTKSEIDGNAADIERTKIALDPDKHRGLLPCFSGDTPVWTVDGPRRIDSLSPGETVLAFDFSRMDVVRCGVLEVLRNRTEHFYDVLAGGGVVHATGQHPFWVESESDWVAARHLRPGMLLRTPDGRTAAVSSVTLREVPETASYNLSVDGAHNYFVGPGLLVHNEGPVDVKLARVYIIYRATYDGKEERFKGKTYIGQTTEVVMSGERVGQPRGVEGREGEHIGKARAELARHAKEGHLTPENVEFYEFMKHAKLKELVVGIETEAQANYLEQQNIDAERKEFGEDNVMNRKEQIKRKSHAEKVRKQILAELSAKGLTCPP